MKRKEDETVPELLLRGAPYSEEHVASKKKRLPFLTELIAEGNLESDGAVQRRKENMP